MKKITVRIVFQNVNGRMVFERAHGHHIVKGMKVQIPRRLQVVNTEVGGRHLIARVYIPAINFGVGSRADQKGAARRHGRFYILIKVVCALVAFYDRLSRSIKPKLITKETKNQISLVLFTIVCRWVWFRSLSDAPAFGIDSDAAVFDLCIGSWQNKTIDLIN